jgi:hypothetical protein
MRRRSVALWLSILVHVGIGVFVAALTSERSEGAAALDAAESPQTIQLSGKPRERLRGRDVLLEVLSGDGMPIRLKSTTGDAAVGLAWWSPSVGLWLAVDDMPAAPSGRRLEASLRVGSGARDPIGTIEIDEHGSGRIVAVWTAERPAADTPITLTVSEPGSLWRFLGPRSVLTGSAPMQE